MLDLELRPIDPAPQAGSLSVSNPDGKALTISYTRLDDDTIEAVLSGLRGEDKVFHINKIGLVEEAE